MRYAIFISAIVLFFCSCSNNSKSNLEVFRTLNEGLIQSSKTISESNISIYHALEDRLRDIQYKNAEKWQPKALQVKLISDSIIKYINELKDELQKETALNKKDEKKLYAEGNMAAVKYLVDLKGKELFDRLINYRKDILSVDSSLKYEFEHTIKLFSGNFNYTKNGNKEFIKTFFKEIPVIAAIAMLNGFENNVTINENDFILFCLNQTHNSFCGYFSRTNEIIGQSINYVKGGENIEITAGIGYFSSIAKPIMTINGKTIEPDVEGILTYNLKALPKTGKHVVPVTIEFMNQDGISETHAHSITYTVINPNQNPQ